MLKSKFRLGSLLEHARLFAARRSLLTIHLSHDGSPLDGPTHDDRGSRSGTNLSGADGPAIASSLALVHFPSGWSLAILSAALLGYFGTRAYWVRKRPALPPDVEAALVQDLRLLENKRLYDQVDNVNFLRSLDVSNLFDDQR